MHTVFTFRPTISSQLCSAFLLLAVMNKDITRYTTPNIGFVRGLLLWGAHHNLYTNSHLLMKTSGKRIGCRHSESKGSNRNLPGHHWWCRDSQPWFVLAFGWPQRFSISRLHSIFFWDVRKVVRLHYITRISCFVRAFQKDLHLVSAFWASFGARHFINPISL